MTEAGARQPEPHYSGHRERLRARFLKSSAEALQDYELLELILFPALPRRDVKPLAKDLLNKFGSLAGLLRAKPEELAQAGLSETTAASIKIIEAASLHLLRTAAQQGSVVNSWSRLLDYIKAKMEDEKVEQFRLIFLNKKNEVITDEVQAKGTVDAAPVYPREVMKRALELNATAIILVHNHPSGDPSPSQDDICMTQNIVAAAKPFNITIHDHIIIARKGHFSFKSAGLL